MNLDDKFLYYNLLKLSRLELDIVLYGYKINLLGSRHCSDVIITDELENNYGSLKKIILTYIKAK